MGWVQPLLYRQLHLQSEFGHTEITEGKIMFGIGAQELLLILLIVLVLFGAKKVPELAKGLGNALREFRKAAKEIESDDTKPEEPPYKA
jgi:sec-independent protein translocase protein TatA